MKLLFLLPDYPSLGGVQTVTTQMANYFYEQRFQVSILSLPPKQQFPRTLRIELAGGIELDYLPDKGDYNSVQNLNYIREYVLKKDIRIIINQGAFSNAYRLFRDDKRHCFINVLRGCPAWEPVRKRKHNTFRNTVLSNRGIKKRIPAFMRYLALKVVPGLASHLAQRELYRKMVYAARFVVLAPGYIEELQALWPGAIKEGQIISIANPLTGTALLSARKPQLIYAGRLTRDDKRVDRLLRIWKQIEDLVPEWSFRIIGEGPEQYALEQDARKLGLKRLSFEAPRMDDSLYAEASIICLSSSYEGFGMVLLEARQAGIVPIAFDCSAGVRDVIAHQRNGLLVHPFDENAYARSLLSLIRDEDLRQRLSEQAIIDAAQNNINITGPQWIALFTELLSGVHSEEVQEAFGDHDSTKEAISGEVAPEKVYAAKALIENDSEEAVSGQTEIQLEVLISSYGKSLQSIIGGLPAPKQGVQYLISYQGAESGQNQTELVPEISAERFKSERPDLRISYTNSRGIAANRNNSIEAATGNNVWLLDDDVRFEHQDLDCIMNSFLAHPEIDVACFRIRTPEGQPYRAYPIHSQRLRSIESVRNVSSIEIAFRLDRVRHKGIRFDERFGLGREWPCGEEFLFLAACLKAGLHIHYFPYPVVEHPLESTTKRLSQYSPVLLRKSGAVNAVLYGRKAYLRNFVSLFRVFTALRQEALSVLDFLRYKNQGSRKLLTSRKHGSA